MDWDKNLQRLAIIVPATHVTSCAFYIVGYSIGFRNQVGSLFSISDFFTITFNHLVLLYASSIVVPTVLVLLRHRSGQTYAQDLVEKIEDASALRRELASLARIRTAIKGVLFAMFFASLAILITNTIIAGFPIYQIFIVFIALSLTVLYYEEAKKHNLYGIKSELGWIAVIFFPFIPLTHVRARCGRSRHPQEGYPQGCG